MPRPKAPRGVDGWLVEPLRIADRKMMIEAGREMAVLANLAPSEVRPLLARVKEALEIYPGLSAHGHIPSPSSQLVAIRALADRVRGLKADLQSLDPTVRDALTMAGADRLVLFSHLDKLERATSIVVRRLDGVESRGKPPDSARSLVVDIVAAAFHDVESGPPGDYADRLRQFIVAACSLQPEISLPRVDRILDLVSPSVKVPRSSP